MSEIILYSQCQITEEKNFQLDGVGVNNYLTQLVQAGKSKTYSNVQYIKQGVNTEVKVVLDQSYLEPIANNYNYCKITNDSGTHHYYFIKELIWTSKNTIKLVLKLDVLNTYQGRYKLSPKTTIQRQHKDRFSGQTDYYFTYSEFSGWFTSWQFYLFGIPDVIPMGTEPIYEYNFATMYIVGSEDTYNYLGRLELQFDNINKYVMVYTWVNGNRELYSRYKYTDVKAGKYKIIVAANSAPTITDPDGQKNVVANVTRHEIYLRKVDDVSEGFTPALWGKDEENLTQQITTYDADDAREVIDFGTDSWYLIYKTHTAYDSEKPDDFIYDNAIDCFLTTDKQDFKVQTTSDVVITKNNLFDQDRSSSFITFEVGADSKKTYNSFPQNIVTPKAGDRIDIEITLDDNTVIKDYIDVRYPNKTNRRRLKQRALNIYTYIVDDVIHCNVKRCGLKRDNFYDYGIEYYDVAQIKFINVPQVTIYTTSRTFDFKNDSWWQAEVNYTSSSYNYYATTSVVKTLDSFKNINRTDAQLIKIINTPYCPINTNVNNELLWNESTKMLTLNVDNQGIGNYDPSFNYTITLNAKPKFEDVDPYVPGNEMVAELNPALTDTRNDNNESKLLHSDYYQQRFVYDSFEYIFRNELLDTSEGNLGRFIVDAETNKQFDLGYCVSNSLASAMGFNFVNFPLKKQFQNYDVLTINRNNEMPIYNNYYLQYLRNGYNQAIKNKERQQVTSGVTTGVMGLATVGAAIATVATEGVAAPALIGAASGLVGSITGAVTNSVNADAALQEKINQMKQQRTSVEGSDDIGLLKWYADNNTAKLMKWVVSDVVKDKLADLFYYCGYKCDYQGIPDTTSRKWFNFIQCNPVFDVDGTTATLGKEVLAELVAKYNEGVTVLHKQNSTWDFDQEKENWETSLFII